MGPAGLATEHTANGLRRPNSRPGGRYAQQGHYCYWRPHRLPTGDEEVSAETHFELGPWAAHRQAHQGCWGIGGEAGEIHHICLEMPQLQYRDKISINLHLNSFLCGLWNLGNSAGALLVLGLFQLPHALPRRPCPRPHPRLLRPRNWLLHLLLRCHLL